MIPYSYTTLNRHALLIQSTPYFNPIMQKPFRLE